MIVALIEGLAALGHRVSLLAPQGTRVPGATVVEVPAAVLLGREGDVRRHIPAGVEILHAHYVVPRLPAGVAFVQTLHGNLAAGDAVPPNTVHGAMVRPPSLTTASIPPLSRSARGRTTTIYSSADCTG